MFLRRDEPAYLQGNEVPECSIGYSVDVISMNHQQLQLPETSQ